MPALVCGVFVIGQVIEGNVLTPYIVGNSVRLHPLWLLFALVGSGYLLGFLGLLISVPLAATIGVLVRYAIRKYYESPLHNDGNHEQEAGSAPTPQG
jgi:predicted PurR-regulated permease PerM